MPSAVLGGNRQVCDILPTSTWIRAIKITSGGSCSTTVSASTAPKFFAENEIILLPNFSALLGSDFQAKIQSCDLTTPIPREAFIDSSLSDELETTELNIEIHPNPAITEFTVRLKNNKEESLKVSLYDMMGNKVKDIYTGNSTLISESINVESLIPGLYLVKIETAKNNHIKKILVAK
jgi:hypothetical protein